MIEAPNLKVELHRIRTGIMNSPTAAGNNGCFYIPHSDKALRKRLFFVCIISDIAGWDHVSISLRRIRDQQPDRLPTWDEMCYIKDLFFKEDETVVQYHPAKKDYVNIHKFVLHLFRPQDQTLVTPPTWLIGPRPGQTLEELDAEMEASRG
jgi:hypothetical protein